MLAPPPKDVFQEVLRSRIVEVRSMNPYEFRTLIVPVWVPLSAAATRGTASYTIPSNTRFRVRQILPHIVPVNVTSETITNAGDFTAAGGVYNGGDTLDRLYAKAMNCRINLGINSRTTDLFPQLSFPISDLFSTQGERPNFVDMPMILTQGTTIDLTASLSDTAAAISNSQTQYGLVFVGSLIRVD